MFCGTVLGADLQAASTEFAAVANVEVEFGSAPGKGGGGPDWVLADAGEDCVGHVRVCLG
jgi:hypothetical protein